MKKVLIIDDEAAGRKLIREYVSDYPQLIVLGEANNGVDAVRLINEFNPDLVFLDVQMPGMNGFDVLPLLNEVPKIIFSTAYDQYAIKAFEIHALDYLLKPYTRERFRQAIERLDTAPVESGFVPLAEIIGNRSAYPERILVQTGRKMVTIAVADIVRVEAFGDYSRLHTLTQVYTSNFGIGQLEEKLKPDVFIRVHRSSIINLGLVKEVARHPASFDVVMQNGDLVTVSRGYMERLKKLMF
jgi:two-component system, LytTR family, response regulator